MRNEFVKLLVEWGKQDDNLYLLTGDLGFSVLEPFADLFPQRFINVGVAEQNMVGIAAGLAKLGKTVFIYSIVNFATLRCLEQIRNDICYHNANVIITIVGGGFAYGTHGYTHLGLEDIAALMPLPNMKILSPADAIELRACMHYIKQNKGPCYLRMARGGENNLHLQDIDLTNSISLDSLNDINLISHGTLYIELLQAQKILKTNYKLDIGVHSLPLIKPFSEQQLEKLLIHSKYLFCYEEHMVVGGLGSRIAQLAASLAEKARVYCRGADSSVIHITGTQAYMRDRAGLSASKIIADVITQLEIATISSCSVI